MRTPGLASVWQPAPSGAEGGALLIVLHGRGDSSEGFTWLQAELGVPRLSALLLDAPDPYGPGRSWYDLPPGQRPGVVRSRALLGGVLDAVATQGFPPQRCLLLGFSQGCLMTLEVGARWPSRLAGYVGISGYCLDPRALLAEATPAARSGDWLVTHGTHDDVLPFVTTRDQVRTLVAGGLPIDFRAYPKGHTIDPDVELPELRDWIGTRVEASLR